MEAKNRKLFMKPGKTNKEDRRNFIKFWVEFMKTHSDEEWSKQQVKFIDSQLKSAEYFYKSLEKTQEGKNAMQRILRNKC